LVKEFLSRHVFVRRALWMLFVYYCFHAAALEIKASRQYRQIVKWPTTEAIINSASVYETSYSWASGRTNRFCPRLDYNYSVAGRSLAGYNRVFDFTCWPDAYKFVAQHPSGTSIPIAYDSSNPTVSVVPASIQDPGYPTVDLIGGALFLIVFLSDLFSTASAPAGRSITKV
jgi:Protein of unknown function (DUF3592)